MPDQHEASSEHALIQEIAEPLSTMPDDPVAIAADVHFPVVLRGYDRIAVDAYVKRTTQLVAELHATRSPEAAVRRALERVGEQISGILQRAHDAAEKITERSRAEAEERVDRAREEAHELAVAAELRVKDLDAETDSIWAERRRIVADVSMLASNLTELAEAALERFPAEEPADAPEAVGSEVSDAVTAQLPDSVYDAEATAVLSAAEADAARDEADASPAERTAAPGTPSRGDHDEGGGEETTVRPADV
jgi:ribosomal 50S subunit-associated protein YjgA (DUF615 family)